jgi:hypothetical protein
MKMTINYSSFSQRKNSSRLLSVAVLAYLVLFTFIAQSHQQKAAITRIELNPRTQMVEVMHRFELHDAEHAVSEIFGKDADIIGSDKTKQQFADYVAARFGLFKADDEALPMKLVGYEVEGKHFWVYQETPKPSSFANLRVVHNALRDIWFAQTNTVNVKLDEKLKTLTFTENTEVLNIDFAH